jgi:hypothetical protein
MYFRVYTLNVTQLQLFHDEADIECKNSIAACKHASSIIATGGKKTYRNIWASKILFHYSAKVPKNYS